jgi:hypothetical protein
MDPVVTTGAERLPAELADRALAEMPEAPVTALITGAVEALRPGLTKAGFRVEQVEVSPPSRAGFPGVVVRRAFFTILAKAADGAPPLLVGLRLVADFRPSGAKSFTLSLEFEARSHHELVFLLSAPMLVALNPALKSVHSAGALLKEALATLGGPEMEEQRETMASQFCAQLNDRLAP